MKKLWNLCGRMLFWATYPALRVYLRYTVRSRVFLVSQDCVLVVRSWYGTGQYGLPGGGVHKKELPAEAALRELKEETSVELTLNKLKFAGDYLSTDHQFKVPYVVYVAELSYRPDTKTQRFEISGLEWLPLKYIGRHRDLAQEVHKGYEFFHEIHSPSVATSGRR